MSEGNNLSIRIRMYRQGLGDCFVLTFLRDDIEGYNLMIDCGLLVGTANGGVIMQEVVKNIKENLPDNHTGTDREKWLDAIIMTHEHADHTSGFMQARDVFEDIEFGEVWAGWPDDKNHPKYKAVRERFHKQVTGLKAAVKKMTAPGQSALRETITALVDEFFDPEILGVGGDNTKRSPAWEYVLDKARAKKFPRPGESFTIPGFDDVRVYVLGPPEDFNAFTRVNPPGDETYRSEGSTFALAESFFSAVAPGDDLFEADLCQPFERHLRIGPTTAKRDEFFRKNYGFEEDSPDSWRRIDDDWLTMAGSLALNLDSYTNNTCLVVAIEFVKSGKVMLFPGDAQFANWISWQNLSWEIPDPAAGGKRTVKIGDLLKRTILYKVGHHGSHNATLKAHGLEMMCNPNLMAMIPVSREKAKVKKWEMPEGNLFERLKERTQGRIIMADEKDNADLITRCGDNEFIGKVSFGGEFVRDPTVSPVSEPLYVQLTIDD